MKKILIPIDASKELPTKRNEFYLTKITIREDLGYEYRICDNDGDWSDRNNIYVSNNDIVIWYKEIDIDELLFDEFEKLSDWLNKTANERSYLHYDDIENYIKQKLEQ